MLVLQPDRLRVIATSPIKRNSTQSGLRPSKNAKQLAQRKLAILERDGFACVTCGAKEDLTIDHIVPFALTSGEPIYKRNMLRGRKNAYNPDNCQTLCESCHVKKDKAFGRTERKNVTYGISIQTK